MPSKAGHGKQIFCKNWSSSALAEPQKALCWRMSFTTKRSHASVSQFLPCLDCASGLSARALEEVVTNHFAYLRGERRLRFDDDRPFPHLPRLCCKNQAGEPDISALVA
jgi:hypothetical protein